MALQADLVATSQARRRQRSEKRLRDALQRLVAEAGANTAARKRLTVAALCRAAGVGRNAVYDNHRFVLDELTQARAAAAGDASVRRDRMAGLRAEVDELRSDKARLATENAGLLVRVLDAETAAATLRRQVETLRRALQQPRNQASSEQAVEAGVRHRADAAP